MASHESIFFEQVGHIFVMIERLTKNRFSTFSRHKTRTLDDSTGKGRETVVTRKGFDCSILLNQ